MKLYISTPISGRPLIEAKHHAECIKEVLESHGHECITPFDVCPETDKSYAHYMGRDIETDTLRDDISKNPQPTAHRQSGTVASRAICPQPRRVGPIHIHEEEAIGG